MYNPSLKEFLKLSKKFNVIPVYKQINADLDTPVSAFLKIKKSKYAFLLESVEGQEKIARYSFLGSNPYLIFESKDRLIHLNYCQYKIKKSFITKSHPLDEIKKIMQDFKAVQLRNLPRFFGGFVGYMGYDAVRFFEKIPDKNPDELNLADFVFMLTKDILVFDHINHTIKIISNIILPKDKKFSQIEKRRIYLKAVKNIESIQKQLIQPLDYKERIFDAQEKKEKAPFKIISNFSKKEFINIIKKAKTYIRKGEIIQVVLSQRFKLKIKKEPFDIYRALRSLNPSPYMFFLKLNNFFLIGSSPEMLVRCEERIIQTRPIAGTRPRGRTDLEDKKLETELLNDTKERAEHIMLVDLGRNDLGRVCQVGKIKINDFMTIERYSHVMHLVTEVSGLLDKKYDIYNALSACFPAGTVTGSPKIRAMEIIDELENIRRGPYAGCVGYFSFSGNMDTCITIRTIIIKDGFAYVQAGAGIVADSLPQKEYLESVNKAKALIEAIVK